MTSRSHQPRIFDALDGNNPNCPNWHTPEDWYRAYISLRLSLELDNRQQHEVKRQRQDPAKVLAGPKTVMASITSEIPAVKRGHALPPPYALREHPQRIPCYPRIHKSAQPSDKAHVGGWAAGR